ncbi:MAG: class I SAM-dependent methyltransferase [Anaerolineales bacterium]|nr:class I SAM-dependent methyltransferase [Anaerolineales bacterium]
MYDHIAAYYDLTHKKLHADRDFLLDLAARTGDPILELGCGSGRLLLPLVEAGFHVTGLDNSAAMLTRARERLLTLPLEAQNRTRLIETDMLCWQNDGMQFMLIIIPYNTLMHFNPQQIQKLFSLIHNWLGENGRLFIDLENPFLLANSVVQNEFLLEDEFVDPETNETVQQFSHTTLDADVQQLHVEWKYVAVSSASTEQRRSGRNPHSTQVAMTYHYRFPHQLEMALTQAGLRLMRIWGGYGRSPFNETSSRLLLLAKQADLN